MKVGSLFSGIGGFDLGLERAGFTIEWQVEIDDYCRRVLAKHWPAVPCHYDITAIDWRFIPKVDVVCGGFPCQPFSCAGKQRGKDDDRYLWPEVVRCLQELQPTWFLGENVPGLLHLGIEQVLADLEALGYETSVLGIPACGVDAPHIRQRLWILAHSECDGSGPRGTEREGFKREKASLGDSGNVATSGHRREVETRGWLPEPELGRVAHGISYRVDRLKGLGNAVVPAIVEAIGKMILEVERENLHWLQRNETAK